MALDRAIFGITGESLQFMVLEKPDMPEEFQGFQVVREGSVRVSKTLARKVRDLTLGGASGLGGGGWTPR